MAVLLFYVHLALQGCFRRPHCSTGSLQIRNWMTNRNLLTPSCCSASVISRPVLNRSESGCGRSRASTPALPQACCLEHPLPIAQSQVRSSEIDAGTLAKPRHPLRTQQRLITCHCGLQGLGLRLLTLTPFNVKHIELLGFINITLHQFR